MIIVTAVIAVLASYVFTAGFWWRHYKYDGWLLRVFDIAMIVIGPASFAIAAVLGLLIVAYFAVVKAITWLFKKGAEKAY